jgi:hypothetical protein
MQATINRIANWKKASLQPEHKHNNSPSGRWRQWQATTRRVGTDGIVGSSGAAFPLLAGWLGGYVSLTPVPLLLEWDIHTLILRIVDGPAFLPTVDCKPFRWIIAEWVMVLACQSRTVGNKSVIFSIILANMCFAGHSRRLAMSLPSPKRNLSNSFPFNL